MSKASNPAHDGSALSEEMRILEALLFASDELLTPAKIKKIIPSAPDARAIRKMVGEINAHLQRERHPFEVVEIGGGYQFRTVAYYHPWLRKLLQERTVKKLSIQALECLAIIAYKQPLSKAEIESIRGVLSDGAMKTLLERRLVTVGGRSDKPGRPLLYVTTAEFLRYFGINKLEDLPSIEEFEAIAREKMEEISDEAFAELEQSTGIAPEENVEGESEGGEDGEAAPAAENQSSPQQSDDSDTKPEAEDDAMDLLGESGSDMEPHPEQATAGNDREPVDTQASAADSPPLLDEEADLADESDEVDEESPVEAHDEEVDESLVDEPSIPTRLIETQAPLDAPEDQPSAHETASEESDDTKSDEAPTDFLGDGVGIGEDDPSPSAGGEEDTDEYLLDDTIVATQEIDLRVSEDPDTEESDTDR